MAEIDKYEVLEKIGHGSFGVIRKVRRKSDGYILCRKEISYLQMSSREREQLQAELSILKGLRHPNIVAYYEREHIKASSDLHIYMEYCEHGDLGRYIKDLKRSNKMADEDFVWSVFSQLVTALYRCHYGEDPPEVGRNVIGLSSDAKPAVKAKGSNAMILHRDLKPENIFLGADASVKLGDFGLSKIMQAHDFASTYVGTPFYMSPEICAAEQYSLHSDIWAMGCIMYELCAKEPPFNAKTHLELIQRIRLGRITPLSHVYSTELKDSIAKCLRVNPLHRPDTVQLLNIPMVKLKRKELEIVRVGRHLKTKEEHAARMMKDAERRVAQLDSDKVATRMEIDQAVRREWEVKARLEIDRQVQAETERLYQGYEAEVGRRVAEEIKKVQAPPPQEPVRRSTSPLGEVLPQNVPLPGHQQSQSTSGETDDFPSSTDLSELSLESPTLNKSREGRKSGRTPFARAQTMFDGSPMDVAMADPSPAPIASLNLSPRRNGAQPSSLGRNIFASAEQQNSSPDVTDEDFNDDDENDDTDEVPALPSPTRARATNGDPFKVHAARRPPMLRQKTAPQNKASAPNLFGHTAAAPKAGNNVKENSHPSLAHAPHLPKPCNNQTSPGRRLSKLPSASNILADAGSPQRKTKGPSTSPTRQNSQLSRRPPSRKKGDNDDIRHAAMMNSHVQGRTLVELAQARGNSNNGNGNGGAGVAIQDFGGGGGGGGGADGGKDNRFGRGVEDSVTDPPNVTVWDPERDEMPSPFLVKHGRGVLAGGAAGGPGMRHLR